MQRVYKRYRHDPDIDAVIAMARVGLADFGIGRIPKSIQHRRRTSLNTFLRKRSVPFKVSKLK
jgi:hypothetical protein